MTENDYKLAYQRERRARIDAENLLDEKTRELSTSMNLVQSQFEELLIRSSLLDLQTSISNFTQKQLSLTESLKEFIAVLGEADDAPYVFVYLKRKSSNLPKLIDISWPLDLPQEINQLIIDREDDESENVVQKVLDKKRIICWSADKKKSPDIARQFRCYEIDGCYAFPIKRFGEVIAIIEIGVRDWSKLHESLIEHIESVSIQLSVALERRQAQKDTQKYIEDLKNAVKNLKETQNQLIRSEKMASLGLLAAGVAHEINNPVGFVTSNIETLREYTETFSKLIELYQKLSRKGDRKTPLEQEILHIEETEDIDFLIQDVQPMLDDSLAGLDRVKDIVNSLKSFARTETTESRTADINQCIENALKLVWNEVKYNSVVVKKLEEVPQIDCYPEQIEQVIMNLIVNAGQAFDKEGEIKISSGCEDDQIVIKVEDNGCGISEEDMSKIFDPFYTTKPMGVGTGLGLSISYGIIDKHDGNIFVDSEVGRGTLFKICLPINR